MKIKEITFEELLNLLGIDTNDQEIADDIKKFNACAQSLHMIENFIAPTLQNMEAIDFDACIKALEHSKKHAKDDKDNLKVMEDNAVIDYFICLKNDFIILKREFDRINSLREGLRN